MDVPVLVVAKMLGMNYQEANAFGVRDKKSGSLRLYLEFREAVIDDLNFDPRPVGPEEAWMANEASSDRFRFE
jgi:hypothetical protein